MIDFARQALKSPITPKLTAPHYSLRTSAYQLAYLFADNFWGISSLRTTISIPATLIIAP
jgi:hypothetical protein